MRPANCIAMQNRVATQVAPSPSLAQSASVSHSRFGPHPGEQPLWLPDGAGTAPGARLPDRSVGDNTLHSMLDYSTFTLLTSNDSHDLALDCFGLPMTVVATDLSVLGLERDAWVLVRPDGHVMAMG